jgi:hypothetical protein
MAIGAYIHLPVLSNVSYKPINTNTVKAIYKGSQVKRDAAKLLAVEWAQRYFDYPTLPSDAHDEAEALAVGVAAATKWRETQMALESTPPMFGKGSRRRTAKR